MKLNRRHAIFGLVAATPFAFARSEAATVSRGGTAFGTTVRLTVKAETETRANAALDAGFAEIRAIGKSFNLFDPSSEVSRLNAAGILRNPSSLMREMLTMTDYMWKETEGAFDPTIQPLWRVWNEAHGLVPRADILQEKKNAIGWRHVHHDSYAVRFARPDVALTFNGIAQGYAADRVAAVFKHHFVSAAWIDTGEIGIMPGGNNTAFSIRDPRHVDKTIATLQVSDGFIATSGDYVSNFTPDFSTHHIFDPDTAQSPPELASVTVKANTGAQADAYATALMVLGSERAKSFSRKSNISVWMVDKRGHLTAL